MNSKVNTHAHKAQAVTCNQLSSLTGITHGFFTRCGGVSKGLYTSLNTGYGSGDDTHAVSANRDLVAQYFGLTKAALCTTYQIHSAKAVILDKAWKWEDAPQADALVTNQPDIILGILTADCLPVLFADTQNRVIGAAHGGWNGAFSGILEATIEQMETLGAQKEHIHATIGPAIAQASYEVGQEFYDRFVKQDTRNQDHFIHSTRSGHFMFDLKSYAQNRLSNAGISQIHMLKQDTCAQDDLFFSYRRACLHNETVYGRQISAISINS